jgi:hypothetical protein
MVHGGGPLSPSYANKPTNTNAILSACMLSEWRKYGIAEMSDKK